MHCAFNMRWCSVAQKVTAAIIKQHTMCHGHISQASCVLLITAGVFNPRRSFRCVSALSASDSIPFLSVYLFFSFFFPCQPSNIADLMFVQKNELWNIRTSSEGIRSGEEEAGLSHRSQKNMLISTSPLIIYIRKQTKKHVTYVWSVTSVLFYLSLK